MIFGFWDFVTRWHPFFDESKAADLCSLLLMLYNSRNFPYLRRRIIYHKLLLFCSTRSAICSVVKNIVSIFISVVYLSKTVRMSVITKQRYTGIQRSDDCGLYTFGLVFFIQSHVYFSGNQNHSFQTILPTAFQRSAIFNSRAIHETSGSVRPFVNFLPRRSLKARWVWIEIVKHHYN